MLSKWVTIDQPTGVISPNQFQTINYTITVPDNAPAGGQYTAIVVSKDPHAPNEKDSNVAVKNIHEIAKLDEKNSLFFDHSDPSMVEWFDGIVKTRREQQDASKEKKSW